MGHLQAGEHRSEHVIAGQFALVAYIPDPLAAFLDHLRIELTPLARPRAHVTILPPRPHDDCVDATIHKLVSDSRPFHSFWVEIGEIEIFAASHVVYLGLAGGTTELRDLYRALNCGSLEYQENFPYHPHVTVAQNIDPEDAPRMAAVARQRWADYKGPRGFLVDHLSFVQNIEPSVWLDVARIELPAASLEAATALAR